MSVRFTARRSLLVNGGRAVERQTGGSNDGDDALLVLKRHVYLEWGDVECECDAVIADDDSSCEKAWIDTYTTIRISMEAFSTVCHMLCH